MYHSHSLSINDICTAACCCSVVKFQEGCFIFSRAIKNTHTAATAPAIAKSPISLPPSTTDEEVNVFLRHSKDEGAEGGGGDDDR